MGISAMGAGGGSMAWVGRGRLLEMGPQSAGSFPGPVAYGQGNDRPTVTDANVALGRIDPEAPIGGGLDTLDVAAARAAIDVHVGRPLGLSTDAAAEAILRVANSRIAGAIRLVSVERGFDPKRFAFMPFGGGGALHAGAMLTEVGIACAIVPRYPGVTSALGCVIADMRHDFVQTINSLVDALEPPRLRILMQRHLDRGQALLDAATTRFEARDVRFELDMAYVGQTHTVAVPLVARVANGVVAEVAGDTIAAAFDAAYRASYGRLLNTGTRRVLNLRTSVVGRRPKFDLKALAPQGGSMEGAELGWRDVYMGGGWLETITYDRLALPAGAELKGPALLVQPDTTVLIEPGFKARIDVYGNTIIAPEGRDV